MSDRLARPRWTQPAVWRWRLLVLEAVGWLILVFLALRWVSFRDLAKWLGPVSRPTPPSEIRGTVQPEPDLRLARDIAAAVRRAAKMVPWAGKCLPQAMAAKVMLACRGLTTTLHLGAAPATATAPLSAHAWLSLGSITLTGAEARAGHAELVRFG
jgi:hypothetical protein